MRQQNVEPYICIHLQMFVYITIYLEKLTGSGLSKNSYKILGFQCYGFLLFDRESIYCKKQSI